MPVPEQENVMLVRRAYRYRSDCPEGEIFVGDEAIAAAEKDGWVDSPTLMEGTISPPEPEVASEPEPPAEEPAEDSEDDRERTDNP